MGNEEAFTFALAMATGSFANMVLRAVVELDVFEIMKRAGPGTHLSAAEIAAHLPTKNPDANAMLDRMLRVLAGYEVLSCSNRSLPNGQVERLYGLSPVSQFFTKSEDGASLAPLCLLNQDKVYWESWYHLKDAVLDGGIAFNRAHNLTLYEYAGIDDRFNKVFNDGMSGCSTTIMKKMVENYKGFEGVSTLVDVAGGIGKNLNMIISKYPTIKGINFDLPHVIKDAPRCRGVENIGGDMFISVPQGDAIFIKWICCDWNDEHCLKFLKNCYAALPDHGKVILYEFIFPKASETSYAARVILNIDAVTLATVVGGRIRTEAEFEALAKGAGFEGFKMAYSTSEVDAVMEFLKKK
uniref:N-methyltransferase n=1 Tax=Lophophora williamsii TaxID=130138 RepID=NMT2_LOPWI|nr:O-methyltransferase OMT3 [Lophophora williamsii]